MFKGEPFRGVDFYNILFQNNDFCSELGKVTLSAGRLESEIILFFLRSGVDEKIIGKTLGQLIKVGESKVLFDKNLVMSLEMICKQRNYLTHNIYALYIELIDKTILERENLIDTDVLYYIDVVFILNENLNNLADIIKKM
jgi:hypothetical protein